MIAVALATALPRALHGARRELRRTNFAGRPVSLGEGVAVTVGVLAGCAARGRRADTLVLAGVGALRRRRAVRDRPDPRA